MVTLVSQQGDTIMRTRADPVLVKALARAFRYQRMLDVGRYASISEIATAEKLERGYLGTLLRLTLLAPDIVEVLLDVSCTRFPWTAICPTGDRHGEEQHGREHA